MTTKSKDSPQEPMFELPLELAMALVDDSDCYRDGHGRCRSHGYMRLERGQKCPQGELKERLADLGVPFPLHCVDGVRPDQCDHSSTGGLCDVCKLRQSAAALLCSVHGVFPCYTCAARAHQTEEDLANNPDAAEFAAPEDAS